MKKGKTRFEDIYYSHKFDVAGVGRMPEGEYFHCAFCRGRGKNFVLLKRDDALFFKVGRTCIGRVGLVIPLSAKEVFVKKEKRKAKVKPVKKEEPKKPEVKEIIVERKKLTAKEIDELFNGIEDDI